MNKEEFYICAKEGGDKTKAVKVEGYTQGRIGVHHCALGWKATHLATGLALTQNFYKTPKKAIAAAKRQIGKFPEFASSVSGIYESETYKDFAKSKMAQEGA